MHFYYFDESGDTGGDLENDEQPVFVFAGISLRDEAWNKTFSAFEAVISDFFGGSVPPGFELHASELLCPGGDGPFKGIDSDRRADLAFNLLDLLRVRKHGTHYIAVDKKKLRHSTPPAAIPYDTRRPYLLAFDAAITLVNWHAKERLGATARALLIVDEKDEHAKAIDEISNERRFRGPATHRVRWIAEISYPVDSKRNAMIQMSDLVALVVRRFLELEGGYRSKWPDRIKDLFAQLYETIHDRLIRKELVVREGRGMDELNAFYESIAATPVGQWKRRYKRRAAN